MMPLGYKSIYHLDTSGQIPSTVKPLILAALKFGS